MSLADLIYPFTRRAREDDRIEREDAALCDANLARIRRIDPDADRIFAVGFTDAYRSPALQDRLTEQVKAYAVAKSDQGRMDLYHALFAGLGA